MRGDRVLDQPWFGSSRPYQDPLDFLIRAYHAASSVPPGMKEGVMQGDPKVMAMMEAASPGLTRFIQRIPGIFNFSTYKNSLEAGATQLRKFVDRAPLNRNVDIRVSTTGPGRLKGLPQDVEDLITMAHEGLHGAYYQKPNATGYPPEKHISDMYNHFVERFPHLKAFAKWNEMHGFPEAQAQAEAIVEGMAHSTVKGTLGRSPVAGPFPYDTSWDPSIIDRMSEMKMPRPGSPLFRMNPPNDPYENFKTLAGAKRSAEGGHFNPATAKQVMMDPHSSEPYPGVAGSDRTPIRTWQAPVSDLQAQIVTGRQPFKFPVELGGGRHPDHWDRYQGQILGTNLGPPDYASPMYSAMSPMAGPSVNWPWATGREIIKDFLWGASPSGALRPPSAGRSGIHGVIDFGPSTPQP